MQNKVSDLYFSSLADSLESSLDIILQLWNELQMLSLEAIRIDSDGPDLFTFSDSCLLLASIMKTKSKDSLDSAANTSKQPEGQWSSFPPSSGIEYAATEKQLPITDDDPLPYIAGAVLKPPSQEGGLAQDVTHEAIGLIYCIPTLGCRAIAGEVSIGIILDRTFRGKGYARQAVKLILQWAFETVHFRRVQVAIIDNVEKDKSISLFTQLGFVHEGIRRRSVYVSDDGSWKDVTYFALLDTEWAMRAFFKPAPKNLWEEMFARHERERQELLRWEDAKILKRTTSTDTIRYGPDVNSSSSSAPQSSDSEAREALTDSSDDDWLLAAGDTSPRWRSPEPLESDTDLSEASRDSSTNLGSDWEIYNDDRSSGVESLSPESDFE